MPVKCAREGCENEFEKLGKTKYCSKQCSAARASEQKRQWQLRNRDRYNAMQREWRLANPARSKSHQDRWLAKGDNAINTRRRKSNAYHAKRDECISRALKRYSLVKKFRQWATIRHITKTIGEKLNADN